MDGLIQGIQDQISAVTNVVTNIGDSISGAFKKVMKISSPSRLFEQYGNFIDEGLAQGIDKGIGSVDDAMDSLYDSVTLPKANVGLYGEEESGYNGLIDIIVQALRIVAPELATRVQVDGNKDRIVDITVQANRDYQRMTGASLYGV
jgi:conjugal transfer/entry exclusion protein